MQGTDLSAAPEAVGFAAPLKLATYFGLVIAVCAFIYGSIIIVRTMLYGNPVAGYPSLLAIILFLGGVQLVAIGVVGEYIGRMFDETKGRPLYLINSYLPCVPRPGVDRDA